MNDNKKETIGNELENFIKEKRMGKYCIWVMIQKDLFWESPEQILLYALE